MSEGKSRYKTTIDGKSYTIVGSKPQTHMRIVSELASEQLGQLKDMTNGLDTERRAVLLAMNTLSKQVELQQKIEELEKEVEQLKNNML